MALCGAQGDFGLGTPAPSFSDSPQPAFGHFLTQPSRLTPCAGPLLEMFPALLPYDSFKLSLFKEPCKQHHKRAIATGDNSKQREALHSKCPEKHCYTWSGPAAAA